jgi:hypothetical protein
VMTQVDLGLTRVGRFDSADPVISVNDVNQKPGGVTKSYTICALAVNLDVSLNRQRRMTNRDCSSGGSTQPTKSVFWSLALTK